MKRRNYAAQIADMFRVIYDNDLTTMSGGNISVRESDGTIWISPSGLDKGALTAEQIVKVTSDGKWIGDIPPSIELPFHTMIYRVLPEARAVIHVHAPNLIAASLLRGTPALDIPPYLKRSVGSVGVAGYGTPGSEELGKKIAYAFECGNYSVILENHAAVVAGEDLNQAFYRVEALSAAFQIRLDAKSLGNSIIPEGGCQLPWFAPEETNAQKISVRYDGRLAEDLNRVASRIYKKRLTLANPDFFCISSRLPDGCMLINPTDVPLYDLTPEDYVALDKRSALSHAQRMHLAIYGRHAGIDSIATVTPTHVMSFAVTGTKFSATAVPESYIVLRNVQNLRYSDYGDIERVLDTISESTHEIIFDGCCCVCCGSSPLKVFDKLEVLECNARAIIDARRLGEIKYMSDEDILEIRQSMNLP
jgi:L-fuculose-phosphate aldolase